MAPRILLAATAALLLLLTTPLHATYATPTTCCNTGIPPLDPIVQRFENSIADLPPYYTLSYPAARELLEYVQAPIPSLATVDYAEFNLPIGPTGNVNVFLFRPKNSGKRLLPTTLYLHGGGWVLGSPTTFRRLMLDLVAETDAAVLFVNYTRAPEGKFPVPLLQSYAVLEYLHSDGWKLGVDARRVAVAGDSAGGNMAIGIGILAVQKRRLELMPRLMALFYPVVDMRQHPSRWCSYQEFVDGPGLTVATLEWFVDAYLPHREDRHSWLASPILTPLEVLGKLPESVVVVAEVDPLRDEGEAMARRLAAAGVRTQAMRVLGEVHDFVMLNGLRRSPGAGLAIGVVGRRLKAALWA